MKKQYIQPSTSTGKMALSQIIAVSSGVGVSDDDATTGGAGDDGLVKKQVWGELW